MFYLIFGGDTDGTRTRMILICSQVHNHSDTVSTGIFGGAGGTRTHIAVSDFTDLQSAA